MSIQPGIETEFGGDGKQPFDPATGYLEKDWEKLKRVYQSNPMDEGGAADVVTQRVQ
jgi:hypothetical protein